MFKGFERFGKKIKIDIEIEAQEQSSLIDTIFNYILILDLQENICRKVKRIDYLSTCFAGRRMMNLWDLSIDISLEVQNQKYN